MLGLPFAFAAHFSPGALKAALDLYRARFKPSRQLERPYVMVAANVVVAEREAEARRLFSSLQQMSLYTLRGSPVALPQPVDDLKRVASAAEIEAINHMFAYSFAGTPETVTSELQGFLKMTRDRKSTRLNSSH